MKTKFGKTIAGVALLFCAYGAGGCHGDLDIMQDNKLSASNMWKEESDATSATYGLYVYLRSALKSMNDVYLCWGELRNGLWGPGTHNTLNGVDQSQVRTSTMSSVNEYADWTALYTTVNQANLVIRHVPAMGLKEKPRAFCLGNAHFIRAYCFFQIARIWGDAPLPLWGYESTDTELFLGRTPVSEVLMRVERDIADAERYVADTSDKTVATPAAVAMLKADYALWMYRMQAGGEAYLAMAQEALGELGFHDPLTNLRAGLGQGVDIVDVEGVERGVDTVVQAALFEEVTVRLSRSGKAARNRNAGTGKIADHLAQGCVLAPHMLHIMDAELIEGNYVLYQGDLSTNCVGKAQGAGHSVYGVSRRLWPGPGK